MTSKPTSHPSSLILKDIVSEGVRVVNVPVKAKSLLGEAAKKRAAQEADEQLRHPELSMHGLQLPLQLPLQLDEPVALEAVREEGVLSDMSAAFDPVPAAGGGTALEAFPESGVLMAQASSAAAPSSAASSGSTIVTATLSTGIIVAGGVGLALALGGGKGGSTADTTPPAIAIDPLLAGDNVVKASEKAAGVSISGTAEAGANVKVSWGGITKIVVATGGIWVANFATNEVPADGSTTVSALATDAAGNASAAVTRTVLVDTAAPAGAINANVATDNLVSATEKAAGVVVAGTAESGSQVVVTWGSASKTVTASGTDTWSTTFAAGEVPADAAISTITAVATDAAGNASAAQTRVLAIDTAAPSQPAVLDVSANNVVNAAEKLAGVVVNGTAEAGASVAVSWGTVTKNVVATEGAWSANFAAGDVPADGTTAVSAVATDAAGNIGTAGTRAVTVDTSVPSLVDVAKSVADNTITLTYSQALDAANPPAKSAFTVKAGTTTLGVERVEVAGTTVVLHLSSDLRDGVLSVSYADPTSGDDLAAIQNAAGNDADRLDTRALADGYIRGASVYIDTNKNGVADVGVDYLAGTTDADGNFFIPGNAPKGSIIAVGGVNIDTGVPNTSALKAPEGSTMVSPLTTLVQTFVEQQVKASPDTVVNAALIAQASTQVASALGLDLPSGASLVSYDPIASEDVAVQQAAAQVATIVALASGGDADEAAKVMAKLSTAIATQSATPSAATIDLASDELLNAVLPETLSVDEVMAISDASFNISRAETLDSITAAQSQALDTVAPAAPTGLTVITPTKNATPVVKVLLETQAVDGTAVVAGDSVQVFDGLTAIGAPITLTADHVVAGFVNITLPSMAHGDHALKAQVTDQVGFVGNKLAKATELVVDLIAPAQPVLRVVAVDDVISAAEKREGVSVAGTAEPGASVALTWGDATKQVVADSNGDWSTTFAAGQVPSDAPRSTITAVATDAVGNASVAKTGLLGIDTAAPSQPAVLDVSGNNLVNASEKLVGIAINGTAEAGANVAVSWGTVTKNVVATGGAWVANFAGNEVPADGSTQVSAIATDAAGNASVSGTRAVVVDTAVPAIAIGSVSGDNVINAAEKATGVTVSGTADAGSQVLVNWGGKQKTVTATGGNWTTNYAAGDVPADDAQSVITADATDLAGNTSAVTSQSVKVDTTPPSATALITAVEDNVPLTAISNVVAGATTNDNTPKLSGTLSAPLGLDEVLAVYDGNTRLGEASLAQGGWSFQAAGMGNGPHTFKVAAVDAAGNQGTLSAAYDLTIDASVPTAKLTVSSLTDDVAAYTGPVPAIGLTNDTQPTLAGTIQGTMAATDVIRVFDGATLLGSANISGTNWNFSPSTALSAGAHSLTAVVENAGGNQGVASSAAAFTIDVTAPAAPVIQSLTDSGTSLTLMLRAEAGGKVTVTYAGTDYVAVATQTDGLYSVTAPRSGTGNNYSFGSKATDAAGNVSATSTQSIILASGSYLDVVKPGSLSLSLKSTDTAGATFEVSGNGTLSQFQTVDFTLVTDPTKVSFDQTTATLWGSAFEINPMSDGQVLFSSYQATSTLFASADTTLASFTLKWLGQGATELSLPFTDVSLGENTGLINPIFNVLPGTGPAVGTNDVADLFLVGGAGAVSATGGTGPDAFRLVSAAAQLTVTDFLAGVDKLDVSGFLQGSGYTSSVLAAGAPAADVAQFKATASTADLALVTAQSSTLDNVFGMVYEALSTGPNKGVVHLFGDTDSAVGQGHVSLVQIDVYLGANSAGGFTTFDLTTGAVL